MEIARRVRAQSGICPSLMRWAFAMMRLSAA